MSDGGSFAARVPDTLAGVRVDRAVSMLIGVSRASAAGLVAGGRVAVTGRRVTTRSSLLAAGAELTVALSPAPEAAVVPDPTVTLAIVYEDEDLVVVDKPPGLVVHPGAGNRSGTLIAGLLARYPDIAALDAGRSDRSRPGVVHRIDRGTSGLLVVARTPRAVQSLVSQMAARTVGRRYLALVSGHLAADRGVVDAPIGRSARTPTKMAVAADGRRARTAYVVLDRLDTLRRAGESRPSASTLVVCTLETGRTHQVRVHLAAIGHPVIGDDRYGPGGRVGGNLLAPGRLFLHAAELSIAHPSTGERMAWVSPLPGDLASVLGGVPALPPSTPPIPR